MNFASIAFRIILSHFSPGIVFELGIAFMLMGIYDWTTQNLLVKMESLPTALLGLAIFFAIPIGVIIDDIQHTFFEDCIYKRVINCFKKTPRHKTYYKFYNRFEPDGHEKFFPILGIEQ